MTGRRAFVSGAFALLAAPLAAEAQPAEKIMRIGILALAASPFYDVFRRALQAHGWIEGKNLLIEFRDADGRPERLPKLAAELADLHVNVIFASVTQAAVAARNITSSIPIVLAVAGNPVGDGLVRSLARPGGNVTGLTSLGGELGTKQLDLLREAVPSVSRVAILFNPDNPAAFLSVRGARAASESHGLAFHTESVRAADQLEGAFDRIRGRGCEALLIPADPILFRHRTKLAQLAAQHRLPTMYGMREYVDAGGLMAYAVSFSDLYRRAATYVDRILRGAKPADLPVEQPAKFELVINLKTAKALGLSIPPSLLLRADQVIE
jgi:putative ABC transport system substrate-binding protein